MKFPQPFERRRSFFDSDANRINKEGPNTMETGTLGTFVVRILFRQNASWQGSVRWVEGAREESFRSVLELALLMDGALGAIDK